MVKILSKCMGAKKFYYLIDTGACFNFLSLELAKELGASSIDYNDNIKFASFDGTVSDTVGSILINLHIGRSTYPIKFYIIKTLNVPGMLGAEFLKEYTVKVDKYFQSISLKIPVNEEVNESNIEKLPIDSFECDLASPPEDFELLPHIKKQEIDCNVVETSKEIQLIGSERYVELLRKISLDHLEQTTAKDIKNIIYDFKNIFYLPGDNLTNTDAASHEIETNSNIPI